MTGTVTNHQNDKASKHLTESKEECIKSTIASKVEDHVSLQQTSVVVRLSLSVLAVLAILSVLYIAAPILVPITLAILLNLLLSPIVIFLRRFRIPDAASAALLIFGMLFTLIVAINYLAEPAEKWLQQAPTALRSLQTKILPVTEPIEQIRDLSKKVDDLTKINKDEKVQEVSFQQPTILDRMTENLPGMVTSLAIVIFLSFFLLAAGDNFLRKAAELSENFTQRRRIVTMIKAVQADLSVYLLTISAINLGLGSCVAVTMYLLNVPNPLLWGALAALLNFVPYIGAFIMAGILALVGIMTFNTLTDAFLLPLIYAGFSILEGQLITPILVGRRLSLNPPIVFVALIFWGWMWGIIGALIAVPILLTLKVLFDNTKSLSAVGKFMEH